MRTFLPCSAFLLILGGCSKESPELQCPEAESGHLQGTLGETPQQIAEAGQRLGAGTENEIGGVVAGLRGHHPKASQGEIVNYLATAYCPRIKANPSLTLSEKRQALQAFSARAEKISSRL